MVDAVRKIAVLGAGTMGSGIAQVAAQSGYDVVLFDLAATQLEKAQAVIHKSLSKLAEKNLLQGTPSEVENRLHRTSHLSDLKGSDFIIEAVVENFSIKRQILQDLKPYLTAQTVFASNTSSIPITQLAAESPWPSQVCGMHFMNPVPLMRLVEVIRAIQTSDACLASVRAVCERMQKTVVEVKDAPGFVVNRILIPMINEAFFVLQENLADPASVDEAMRLGCHFPMGPLQLADFVGLDVVLSVCEILQRDLGDSKYRPCPLLRQYVQAGWHGKKTGRGVYSYA